VAEGHARGLAHDHVRRRPVPRHAHHARAPRGPTLERPAERPDAGLGDPAPRPSLLVPHRRDPGDPSDARPARSPGVRREHRAGGAVPPGVGAEARRRRAGYGLVRTIAFGSCLPGPTLNEPAIHRAALPPPSRLSASRAPRDCITYAVSVTLADGTIAREMSVPSSPLPPRVARRHCHGLCCAVEPTTAPA